MRSIIAIIVLVAIGGAIWFFAGTPETAEEVGTESENSTVEVVENDDERTSAPETEFESNQGTDVGAEFPIPDTPDTLPTNEVTVVTYTDNGFSPSTVTVSAGQTVRFVNESSRGMWVGSDNHPSHTIYPESTPGDCLGSAFDQCESTGNGTSWEFTFTTAGSWGYHNHVRSSHGGTVVVE